MLRSTCFFFFSSNIYYKNEIKCDNKQDWKCTWIREGSGAFEQKKPCQTKRKPKIIYVDGNKVDTKDRCWFFSAVLLLQFVYESLCDGFFLPHSVTKMISVLNVYLIGAHWQMWKATNVSNQIIKFGLHSFLFAWYTYFFLSLSLLIRFAEKSYIFSMLSAKFPTWYSIISLCLFIFFCSSLLGLFCHIGTVCCNIHLSDYSIRLWMGIESPNLCVHYFLYFYLSPANTNVKLRFINAIKFVWKPFWIIIVVEYLNSNFSVVHV